MSNDSRITAHDWSLVQRVGRGVAVGKAFAFVFPAAFSHPELAWVRSLFGQRTAEAPQIVSLLGTEPIALPGATVRPLELPPLALASLTSDKELYREGRDTATLLALDPLGPLSATTVVVSLDGAELSRHEIRLDAAGAATLVLDDLPAGSYSATFVGVRADADACEFTVAEYRLAPLVASLVERRFDAGLRRLWVRLKLEAFGTPVEGGVRIDLAERGQPRASLAATARSGFVDATFALDGDGPYSLDVMLGSDPSRTATVPVPGSRATERAATVFSALGDEVSGSLLPSPGARGVRGIFLEAGARRTTPFHLERVDTRRARLLAATAAGPVAVAVVDPSFPAPRPDALDPARTPHPATGDPLYERGERLFRERRFAEALDSFERGRAGLAAPHPYYAYFAACCHARLGSARAAVTSLRTSIEDGWTDLAHLAADEDLAPLRGFAPYDALAAGGRRVTTFEAIAAGAIVEFDVPEPAAIVAVGAVVDGAPWEGWAATVAPSTLEPRVVVPETCAPSSEVAVAVETGRPTTATVYLVVKDARLLTGDAPANRLAARIKAFVAGAGERLAVGAPDSLANLVEPPYFPAPTTRVTRASVDFDGVTLTGSRPAPTAYPLAMPAMPMPSAPAAYPPRGAYDTIGSAGPTGTVVEAPTLAPVPESRAATAVAASDEPEVVFAGLVAAANGRAHVTVRVGDGFADYVAEAFVLDGGDWAAAEARFRAEKDPFASLDLPAFVHPDDVAVGRVVTGASGGAMEVRVTRDGAEVPLVVDGCPLSAGSAVRAARAEISFLAGPGAYEVTVRDLARGGTDRATGRVDAPGRLRRIARGIRLLEPGERVSRDADASIVALRVLPSLDAPFRALVDATADYGHACCEQTAAKLISACAMYAFADSESETRRRAESIVIAGVRRERSMWLRGRGFKMYPDSADVPHDYYGPMTARYLWNLALLRDGAAVSPALGAAIADGIEMAADASRAYRLAWPPSAAATCEEGYAVVRFGDDPRAKNEAVAMARARAHGDVADAVRGPYASGAVAARAESAYAAATLLRGGAPGDRRAAIALANAVAGAIGENGRLYSTVDSVAAIALLGELRAARVLGGGDAAVEIDGQPLRMRDAVAVGPHVRSVAALDGLVAVEVSRLADEDWSAFAPQVPVAISLEKDGRPMRRFSIGDAVSLRARLEGGYTVGDLLWVCLPDALSRVVGGGQVKRFSVDFEGKSEVVVPLAATSVTPDRSGGLGVQRFAACVRNMFEQERTGSPGHLDVAVVPDETGGGGAAAGLVRMFESLKGLLSSHDTSRR